MVDFVVPAKVAGASSGSNTPLAGFIFNVAVMLAELFLLKLLFISNERRHCLSQLARAFGFS